MQQNAEARKVQITGKSTHIISLPKKWVDRVQIRGGDMVFLTPRSDGTLLLNPGRPGENGDVARLRVDVTGRTPEYAVRQLLGAYLAGWEWMDFTIGPSDRTTADALTRLSRDLIGAQMLEERPDRLSIQILLDPRDFTPIQGVRRMYALAREMHRDAVASLCSANGEAAENIANQDLEVNRLHWFLGRQSARILRDVFYAERVGLAPAEAPIYLLGARAIERFADHATKIARQAVGLPLGRDACERVCELSDQVLSIMDVVVRTFYQNKFEEANEYLERAEKVRDDIHAWKRDVLDRSASSAQDVVPLAHVADSLERSLAYATDLAEATLDHHYLRLTLGPDRPGVN